MQFALISILEYFLFVSATVPPPFTVAADPFKNNNLGSTIIDSPQTASVIIINVG